MLHQKEENDDKIDCCKDDSLTCQAAQMNYKCIG